MKPLITVYIMACWFAASMTLLITLILYPQFEPILAIRVLEIIVLTMFVILAVVLWVVNIKRYAKEV